EPHFARRLLALAEHVPRRIFVRRLCGRFAATPRIDARADCGGRRLDHRARSSGLWRDAQRRIYRGPFGQNVIAVHPMQWSSPCRTFLTNPHSNRSTPAEPRGTSVGRSPYLWKRPSKSPAQCSTPAAERETTRSTSPSEGKRLWE